MRHDFLDRPQDGGGASALCSPDFYVEHLKGGWLLFSNSRIGTISVPIVLARNNTGVALFELDPVWTADLVPRFRDYLRDSGFDAAFPGHLPVIHRRLRRDDIPHLDIILDEGFVFQDHISVAPDNGWCRALQVLLTPVVAAPAPPPLPPLPAPPPRRMRQHGGWAVTGLALAGLAAAVTLPSGWLGHGPGPQVVPAEAAEVWLPLGLAQSAPPAEEPDEAPVLLASLPPPVAELPLPQPPAPPEPAPVLAGLVDAIPGLPAAVPMPEPDSLRPPLPPLAEATMADEPPVLLAAVEAPPALPVPPPPPAATPAEPPEPLLAEAPPAEPPPAEAVAAVDTAPEPQPTAPEPPPAVAEAPPAVAEAPRAVAEPARRPAGDPALTAMLLRRGHSLLELGDISGARRFLERAEAGGSAEAARALAETYDPRTLAGFRTRGLQPDPLAALAWYRRAAALGAAVSPQIAALESSR